MLHKQCSHQWILFDDKVEGNKIGIRIQCSQIKLPQWFSTKCEEARKSTLHTLMTLL